MVELSELVRLRDAFHTLRSIRSFEVRYSELGISREVATEFLGVDWATGIVPARQRVDQAIASLGGNSPVAAASFEALVAGVDTGTISPAVAVQQYGDFAAVTGAAVDVTLDRLEGEAHEAPLVAALESLQATSDLADVGPSQVIDLSTIWFPSPGATPQTAAATLVRFGAESAAYTGGVERVRDLEVTSVVADLDRLQVDPAVRAFEDAVAASLLGTPFTEAGLPLDTAAVAGAFRGYLARDERLDGLVATATTAVRDDARRLASSERAELLTSALVATALAVVSVGIALRLARSISQPLKDLAGYAHAVNEGNLDAEPPRQNQGPSETRLAFRVFTDLVANLQLLDAKANALAHSDFDDPVLREPLPGRLGRSLESSVALLSGSIVERDRLQTHLAHQATHDWLTGILNRPAAITGIQAAMHRATRTGATTTVLFVDLNGFKAVNDSHGHEVGDEVLRQVAVRMAVGLRSGDFVARLGGDEFVIVAEGLAGVAEATDLARRTINAVSRPIKVGEVRVGIGAAVGIAMTLDGPEDPLRLLARADAAMYRAKQHERSAIEIFDTDLQRQMVVREDVETALTAALATPGGGGLQLRYQPILSATSGVLVGTEALIRWDRPGPGLLGPDSFIPLAEETALIIEVDRWVLGEATRQLVAWSTVPELARVPVSVNISGRHLLSRKLPDHIRAALDESGIDPHLLSIDVTETALLNDLVVAAAELDAVRALGVRVAIDDFGTGYTSLAHLQQLPIDMIKIDRSFISQVSEQRGKALVSTLTDLAHAIDIGIVAEGVETDDELRALQSMGADHIQGFLLTRPLEPAALATWARDRVVDIGWVTL